MFGFQRLERRGLNFFGYGPEKKMKKWLEGKGYRQDPDDLFLGIDYYGNPLELADDEDLQNICNWLCVCLETAEDIGQFIDEEICNPEDIDKLEEQRVQTMLVEAKTGSLALNKVAFGLYDCEDSEDIQWKFGNRYLWKVYDWLEEEGGYESSTGPERAAELIAGYIDAVGDLAA